MFRRPAVARRRGAPLLAAAAVGGVSYMAGKSVARKSAAEAEQDERLQELEQTLQQYAPQPQQPMRAAPPQQAPQQQPVSSAVSPQAASDRITQLKDLAALRDSGVLTDAEFEIEKQRILTAG